MNIETYEQALNAYRAPFCATLLAQLMSDPDPRRLMLFWIYFSSQGVGMTGPIESWVRRAGERCKALGFEELGEQLCKHALHEVGHEQMMIADTKHLIQEWNRRYMPILSADDFLNQPSAPSVLAYQNLHEDCIASNHPYAQIALEYEIENLSIVCGPPLFQHTLAILGNDFKASLTFVDEHIQVDVAHTEYNRKALSAFLKAYPETLNLLIQTGKKALDVYGAFLMHCHQSANTFVLEDHR